MDDPTDLKMQDAPAAEAPRPAPRRTFAQHYGFRLLQVWAVIRQFWILVVLVVGGTASYLLITQFLFISVRVDGQSMIPSLEDTGNYWVNRLAYIRSEPQATDIVALKDPEDGVLVVKRIIATPGQSLYLHQGKVYLDGKLLHEPYLMEKTYTFASERKSGEEFFSVGKDQYFVMGDNRNYSTDSRAFGTVPRENILGKVIH